MIAASPLQVTATEGSPVDRARAWCRSIGVPYFRFSTPMSKDYALDTKDDKELVTLLWETVEYLHENRDQIRQFAALLQDLQTVAKRHWKAQSARD